MAGERQFDPWKPDRPDPRWAGVRLLLVGESHYDEGISRTADEARRETIETVRLYGTEAKTYQRFFANTYAAVTGGGWSDAWGAYRSFWNSVFFYNYVQEFVSGGARDRPTSSAFAEAGPAFLRTLDELAPEAVLVLGSATWQAMTTERGRRVEAGEGGPPDLWAYRIGEREAFVTYIRHPSSTGFSAVREHPRVAAFLDFVVAHRSG